MTSPLQAYQESLLKARTIQEAAATTAEITKEMKPTTSFTIPADGIAVGTLLFQLRSHGAVNVKVVDNGSTHTITTTNPGPVAKILKTLGLVATVTGEVADLQAENTKLSLANDSTNGTIGESYMARVTKKLKKFIKG